jgi:S-layer protein
VLKNTAGTSDNTGGDGANATITNAVDTAADSVSVVLDAISSFAAYDNTKAATTGKGVGTLNVAGFETVNLESKKSDTVTANTVNSLTDTLATALNITGDADLTITSTSQKLTSIDATALTGKLNITVDANDVNAKLTGKDDTIAFGANLNNKDTVDGGAGNDTLTATVSGLTATTGKLNIANVENITLTTGGDNTLDLSGVTGAKVIAVSANTQTITGLDLATKLQVTDAASLKVTAANATGTDDTLTVEQKLNGDVTNAIEAKGGAIENLAIIMNDTGATANTGTFTLTNFEGKKVTVTQAADSVTDTNVALGILNKNVLTVDTSAMKGTQSASAANATAAVLFNLGGTAAATVTGSNFGDTFNIGTTTTAVHAITGGAGTDTVNITMAATTAADFTGLDVEKVNITVNPGDDITVKDGKTFAAAVTDVTVKGGNSASTYTQGTGSVVVKHF